MLALAFGSRPKSDRDLAGKKLKTRPPWHAVSIAPGPGACRNAELNVKKRWLAAEAPRLPLSGCDAATCDCRYIHHSDRRAKSRRQIDREYFGRYFDGEEQRQGTRGRRSTDHDL
jgi:hypothetical protein